MICSALSAARTCSRPHEGEAIRPGDLPSWPPHTAYPAPRLNRAPAPSLRPRPASPNRECPPLSPWARVKCSSHSTRASPEGRTRTKTCHARPCSPRSVAFRRCLALAVAWPVSRRSRPADRAQPSRFPSPRGSSTARFSAQALHCSRSTARTSPTSRIRRIKSHIWDFTILSLPNSQRPAYTPAPPSWAADNPT